MSILAVNGGSSSIRFALFEQQAGLRQRHSGKVERIGLSGATLEVNEPDSSDPLRGDIAAADFGEAFASLLSWLDRYGELADVTAVGHRIVHGMGHTQPELITPQLLEELRRLAALDPDHLPAELQMIEALRERQPGLVQVACFDTAFHHGMPRVAQLLPIPRQYADGGVRRYGFHGLSYEYLMEELARLAGEHAASGRVILAHLGNGASLAAVRGGHSIDTSMGFTPTGGMPMGTRSGDLDPGLAAYLQNSEGLSPAQFFSMVNHDSGLLGISGSSADMRDLLAREADDVRAAEAIAYFCYQARKWVGAYAAALGGVDTLVFAGGIGENAAPVRERICAGLEFLGIQVDAVRNAAQSDIISTDTSRTTVRIIRTDEERMIARSVARLLGLGNAGTGAT